MVKEFEDLEAGDLNAMLNRAVALSLSLTVGVFGLIPQAIAAPICSEDLTEIVPQLLEDLPSYGNRVIQRSRQLDRAEDTFSYIVTAGAADLRPLTLRTQQYTPTVPDTTQQIFFSTLEKQYRNNSPITFTNHYWLFLTPINNNQWAIANLVFSRDNPPSPPQDATRSTIGQATEIWLRDYNANCGSL